MVLRGAQTHGTTATCALSPEPLNIGPGQGMAQLHPHLWHTHPDVSPFVPLAAAQLSLQRMDFAGLAQQGRGSESSSRQPESMQVDSTSAAPGANASASSGAAQPAASASASSSEAGPSGVQPGAMDTSMTEPQPRRPPRKHSDAPMRKLSVSLIDTYKLINQVWTAATNLHATGGARPHAGLSGGRGPPARGATGRTPARLAPSSPRRPDPVPPWTGGGLISGRGGEARTAPEAWRSLRCLLCLAVFSWRQAGYWAGYWARARAACSPPRLCCAADGPVAAAFGPV